MGSGKGRTERQRFRAGIAAKYGAEARAHLILASVLTRELEDKQRYGAAPGRLIREQDSSVSLLAEKIARASGISGPAAVAEALDLIARDIQLL